jgi:NAD(P)-dependent dehydrogenase (short-subunit alcohol dehydrogenase family)
VGAGLRRHDASSEGAALPSENPDNLARRLHTTPLRRIREPDDIGGIAAFLASPAAAYITGQIIVADGGVTIA